MTTGQTIMRRALRGAVFTLTATLMAGTFVTGPAFAQNATPAEVGRVPARVERLEEQKVVIPEVTAPDQPRYVAPKDAEKIKFTLKALEYDGLDVYTAEKLNSRFADRFGKEIKLSELYQMASELVSFYRSQGYLLTQVVVPPQEIENGVACLQVVPGHVDRVEVEGEARDKFEIIRKLAKNIKKSKPLHQEDLERYLLLINDLPGLTARSVLSPSTDTPGAATMRILTEVKRFDYSAQIDNRGSRYLGPMQLTATGQFNNAFGAQEAIGVQYLTAPEGWTDRELDYLGFYYIQPVGAHGSTLELDFSQTWTEPGFSLGTFEIKGRSKNAGLTVRHPVKRSRTWNLDVFGTFSYNDVNRTSNAGPEVKDRIRALRVGGEYERTDRLFGASRPGLTNASAVLSQGLDMMGHQPTMNPTRANGDITFTKMEMELTRLQRLNDKFDIYGGVSGQYSANTLFSAEEFGVGGTSYGRAYDNSEIVGEDGVATSIELRFNPDWNHQHTGNWQFYTWYDFGIVWNRDTLTNTRESLASTGVGARVDINENVFTNVEVTVPLTRDVDTEMDRDGRVFLSLGIRG